MSDELTTVEKLAALFRELWDTFTEGGEVDGGELQDMMEATGLCVWRECTDEEAERMEGATTGDPLLFLTIEGKRIYSLGQERKEVRDAKQDE